MNFTPIGQEILQEFVEGTEQNVRAATALAYVMEGTFVERYRTKMSPRRRCYLLCSFGVNNEFLFSF